MKMNLLIAQKDMLIDIKGAICSMNEIGIHY